jgi:acetylglutamate kinase
VSTTILVVKVGGAALASAAGAEPALRDTAHLCRRGGCHVALVHGGGREITAWCDRVGLPARFVDGLRATDADTAAVVEMVLRGRVGPSLAAALTELGTPAVSLGGKDAALFRAAPLRPGDGDLGLVGRVSEVHPQMLADLWACGYLPVVAPVAAGPGGSTFNINADDAAADLAVALGASALILASDVPGLLVPGSDRPVPVVDGAEARRLIASGVAAGGMRPKLEACLRAVEGGVATAWIVDGRRAGAVLEAAAGEAAAGTRVVARAGA